MPLIKCPDCGTEVSNKAEKCPKCARPILEKAALTPEVQKTEKPPQAVYKAKEGLFLSTLNVGCFIIFIIIILIIVAIIYFSVYASVSQ